MTIRSNPEAGRAFTRHSRFAPPRAARRTAPGTSRPRMCGRNEEAAARIRIGKGRGRGADILHGIFSGLCMLPAAIE